MILLTSCEKEKDFGKALYSGDEMISYLTWSEYGDEIYFAVERDNYRRTLYGVGINTGDSWKIGDITANYGAALFQKDGKLFYFNDLAYMNTKLYSIDVSGGTPGMIIDSLESPVFSRKYVAYLRSYYFPDTSYTRTILYDLDNKTERIIEPDRNYIPVAISPDGSTLLLRWWNYYYMSYLTIYNTESGLTADLATAENSYYFNYFWIDNEVYTFRESGMGTYEVYNLATRQKLSYSEPLTYQYSFAVSPSGSKIAYIVTEYPALAGGWVGNHYYLHILKAGASGKTVVDMEREYISGSTLTFSPDETRIAYVRDDTDIYIMTTN